MILTQRGTGVNPNRGSGVESLIALFPFARFPHLAKGSEVSTRNRIADFAEGR